MSELETLRARVSTLEEQRQKAREAFAAAEANLEQVRAHIDGQTRRLASQRRQRQLLVAAGVTVATVLLGLTTWVAVTWVESEVVRGEVTEATAGAPVAVGDACTLRLEQAYIPHNAQLFLDCGGGRVYGHGPFGMMSCETEGSMASRCVDDQGIADDGDPRLIYTRGRDIVIDDASGWRATIDVR